MSRQDKVLGFLICFLLLAALSFVGREDYEAQRVIDATPVTVLAVSR
jgi:hypothetical protein